MCCAIDLNGDHALAAEKICEVTANRCLTNKFQTGKPPATKVMPDDVFCRRLLGAQNTRAICPPGLLGSAHGETQVQAAAPHPLPLQAQRRGRGDAIGPPPPPACRPFMRSGGWRDDRIPGRCPYVLRSRQASPIKIDRQRWAMSSQATAKTDEQPPRQPRPPVPCENSQARSLRRSRWRMLV